MESMNQTFNRSRSYDFTFTGLLPFTNYSLVTVVQYEQVMAANGVLLGPEMDYSETSYMLTRGKCQCLVAGSVVRCELLITRSGQSACGRDIALIRSLESFKG